MIQNNAAALTPLIFLFAGIIIPLAALISRRLVYPVTLVSSLAAAALSVFNLVSVLSSGPIHYTFGGWFPPVGIEYVLDPLSAFITTVINLIALGVLVHSAKIVTIELPGHKTTPYFALVMLFLCGCNGIVMTGDFFNLYVFLEISSLALYGIIAVGDKKSPVAAFRYLILGTVGGSFYLLGTGFLYLATGSLNMADVKAILAVLETQSAPLVGLSFMVIGLGIKMAIFPLHTWLPDAYAYAPSASSSIMAPIGIKIGAYGILRILFFVFGIKFVTEVFPVAQVLTWLSAAGIIYGSLLAIKQNDMKRMLAYSSVSQIGYIGLGIGLANTYGIIGAVLHVLNHGLMKACLFLVAGNIRTRLKHTNIALFDDTLRRKMPWTTAAFLVGALAMIGLPPTVGFFSKWYLAMGTITGKSWHFLAVILLSSLLNAVYFFRVIEKMFLKPLNKKTEKKKEQETVKRTEVSASMLIPTLVFAVALIVIGLLNAFIVNGILTKVLPPGLGD